MKFLHYAAASAALATAAPALAQENPVFTEADFRLDMQQFMRPGEAVLELTTTDSRGGSVVLEIDEGDRALFRDDGRHMDERAGDGIFTGVVRADINRERAIFQRNLQALRRNVPVPVFEGRQHVRTVRSSRFIKKKKPSHMQIFHAGAMTTVDADKSLFIVNTDVLNDPALSYNPCTHSGDPDGAWAFAHIWTELAGTGDPETLAEDWVNSWDFPVTANGITAGTRPITRDRIFNAWDSDQFGVMDGTLAMEDCPFHPIAITLRIDLRNGTGYSTGNAGEARIIYSFVDDSCNAGTEGFLAIFEYAINKSGCSVKEWGQRWADLSDINWNTAAGLADYKAELEILTREFTDLTTSPNSNRLGQLRTNELQNFSSPWQLREFNLTPTNTLEPVTVKLTPMLGDNESPIIADIVNSMNALDAMMQPICIDPDPLLLDPTVGPVSDLFFDPLDFFWNDVTPPNQPFTAILNNDCRHEFSLNTCNGCHGGETQTEFTHVTWTTPGVQAPLSAFITGGNVSDPVDGTVRNFNELLRRETDLQNLIDNSCFGGLINATKSFVH